MTPSKVGRGYSMKHHEKVYVVIDWRDDANQIFSSTFTCCRRDVPLMLEFEFKKIRAISGFLCFAGLSVDAMNFNFDKKEI